MMEMERLCWNWGLSHHPYFLFYFFIRYWEQGLLNRRNGLFSSSPVVPHACSPSGCLFSPKYLSNSSFSATSIGIALTIIYSRIFHSLLLLIWGVFLNFHPSQEWVGPILQTSSESHLPSTPSDLLLSNCQCLSQFNSLGPQTKHRARCFIGPQ